MKLHSVLPRLALAAACLAPVSAWALDCDDIANMLEVSVPSEIVIQTIGGSGSLFDADDLRCLAERGVPEAVLAAARAQARIAQPEPAEPGQARAHGLDPEDGFESTPGFDLDPDAGLPDGDADDASPEQAEVDEVQRVVALVRAGKLLTASHDLHALLQEDRFPHRRTQLQYYLAKCLLELGFPNASQDRFLQVVRAGPRDPYFRYAVPKLVALAEQTGNDAELLRFVHKIPPEHYPQRAADYLYFLSGKRALARDDLSDATAALSNVSDNSPVYPRARYFQGVVLHEQGRLRSAFQAFRDVIDTGVEVSSPTAARNLDDLKALALLDLARIYYGVGNYAKAAALYHKVPRGTDYWADSVFERSWAEYRDMDLDKALGSLLTLSAPHFEQHAFLPEATLVQALSYFSVCQWDRVTSMLEDFEARHVPMKTELDAFVAAHRTADGEWLADAAFADAFGPDATRHLPEAFFERVLRNRDLQAMATQLDAIDAEVARIGTQKAVWRDSLGAELIAGLQTDRVRYERRAGLALLRELDVQRARLGDLLTQSRLLRFEVVDGERRDAMEDSLALRGWTPPRFETSYAVDPTVVSWPFNGEFWDDELGYYRVEPRNECRDR